MNEEELLKRYGCNSLGSFIDGYLTCEVAYDLLRSQFKEIERLNNIINEAIEYIENNSLYEQDYDYDYEENLVEYPPSDEQAKKELLEILKGDKNE